MAALSGWKQLVVALAIAGGLVVIIRLAGVCLEPGHRS